MTGISYSAQGEYRINTNDEDFFTSKMFETAGKMCDSFDNFVTGLRDIVWDTGATLPVTNNIDDFMGH